MSNVLDEEEPFDPFASTIQKLKNENTSAENLMRNNDIIWVERVGEDEDIDIQTSPTSTELPADLMDMSLDCPTTHPSSINSPGENLATDILLSDCTDRSSNILHGAAHSQNKNQLLSLSPIKTQQNSFPILWGNGDIGKVSMSNGETIEPQAGETTSSTLSIDANVENCKMLPHNAKDAMTAMGGRMNNDLVEREHGVGEFMFMSTTDDVYGRLGDKHVTGKDSRQVKGILRPGPQTEYKASHRRHVDWTLPTPKVKTGDGKYKPYRCGSKGSKRLVTVDELMNIYTAKCRLLETRPLRKMMEQLEKASTNQTQLRHIFLSDTPRITFSDWEAVAEVVSQNGFLLSLDCSKSSLNEMSLPKLTSALSRLRSFESLNASHNPGINAHGMAGISFMLSHCRRMRNLDLSGIQFDRKMAGNLAKALHTASLETLSLIECGLKNNAIAETILYGCGKAPSLKTLKLMGNGISETAILTLGEALRQPLCSLQHLDLRSNAIGDVGAKSLARAFQSNDTLRTVVLWRNQIKWAGLCYLAQGLRENTGLSFLDASYNECASEQAIGDVRDLLLNNQTIKKLSLVFTGMDGGGLIALSEALPINNTLELLDIRFNAVNTAGFMALASTVRMNVSLTEILTDLATSKTDDEILMQVQSTIDAQCKLNLSRRPKVDANVVVSDLGTRYKDVDAHMQKASKNAFNVEGAYKRLIRFEDLLNEIDSSKLENNEDIQSMLNYLLRAQPDLLSCIEDEKDDTVLSEYLLLNSRVVGVLQQYDVMLEKYKLNKPQKPLIDFGFGKAKGMLSSTQFG
eukprot:CFRG1669T1